MIKKHYSGLQRRAENIIWNAAGRYDFDPPFMAFLENGEPDGYYNMVIGLAVKWLDIEKIENFFASYAGSHKADEFDSILWLGIENCVYEKEVESRPILRKIRAGRARRFYQSRQTLSRQQMMLQSMPVYDQEQARWAKVLGRRGDSLPSKERKLVGALEFSGDWDTEAVITAMKGILRSFFHYDVDATRQDSGPHRVSGGAAQILRRVLRREQRYHDTLIVRNGTGEGDREGSAQLSRGSGDPVAARNAEEDLAYIRAAFGENILRPKEMTILENNLLKGAHADCRLWVARSRTAIGKAQAASATASAAERTGHGHREAPEAPRGQDDHNGSLSDRRQNLPAYANTYNREQQELLKDLNPRDAREIDRARRDLREQNAKNEQWLHDRSQLIASGIRRLTARIDEALSSAERALPEGARAGSLIAEKAYRLPVLHDPDVFERPGEETERSVTVDLLLDASASRLNYEEQLAAEAYVIAKSFMACRVPVQVETFRSLRGYTVLQILKERDSSDCRNILTYKAGGWNRDGLGLRLAGSMVPDQSRAGLRILLVLTDASPNDSTRIPAEAASLFAREYQGRAAVLDAKSAVADIREENVRVAAVFLGPTLYLENLHTIYGKECVRIHRIEQLDEGVSDLLEMILREAK